MRRIVAGLSLAGALWSVPAPAWAQANSGIAGVVRDTSGAVLPGVTVEASSPALIEKVRRSPPIRRGATTSSTCVRASTPSCSR